MKNFYVLFFCFYSLTLFGQQAAQSSQYMLNQYSFNPAYAGFENTLVVIADIRKQWINLEGSPSTQNINFHLPFYFLHGGIGFNLENDQLGLTRTTKATASYNYIYDFGSDFSMSVGIGAGIGQFTFEGSKLRSSSGNYEPGVLDHNDLILSSTDQSALSPVFDAGILLSVKNFSLGLSSSNVAESSYMLNGEIDMVSYNPRRQYFGMLSYKYEVNSDFSLEPSLLLKSDAIENQVDWSILARLADKYILGGSYRGMTTNQQDAIVILAGIRLNNNFTISYSFDIGLSNLNSSHSGSHEFLVKYDLNKKIAGGQLPNIIYNPRFL